MMSASMIHPNWERPPVHMMDGYSLEITAKDVDALAQASAAILPETPVAITFLPGETLEARVDAARQVRALGFEPMPHFSARRLVSGDDFETYLATVVREAGVTRSFVIAGDPAEAAGPYSDSMALIRTGAFERAGIRAVGIGGHPEGHPNMTAEQTFEVLVAKCREIEDRGMAPLIVTQFSFDAQPVLDWLLLLRARGIDAPVRIGVPGPAGIKTLMRFAARCGVGASAAVLGKYGISITKLLGTATPDRLVDALAKGLGPDHGKVRLHFYPFGGIAKTVEWINDYSARQ
ncbi:methylenetetrahydrofolate reductase [Sphingobium amiense]|uniref:methylenetetrahydrofolate reductase (NADH) n=2 Tax=Sphingobium amiense TaxID=135719 RepID=A0A494W9I0_9SPHN|nr:methylenetetrahydrofolate reductase [Sphingobium amiense]